MIKEIKKTKGVKVVKAGGRYFVVDTKNKTNGVAKQYNCDSYEQAEKLLTKLTGGK